MKPASSGRTWAVPLLLRDYLEAARFQLDSSFTNAC